MEYVRHVFPQAKILVVRYDKWQSDHKQKNTATALREYLITTTIMNEIASKPPQTVVYSLIQVEKSLRSFEKMDFNTYFELYFHAEKYNSELREGNTLAVRWEDTVWVLFYKMFVEYMVNSNFNQSISKEDLLEVVFFNVKFNMSSYLNADSLWDYRRARPVDVLRDRDLMPPPSTVFSLWDSDDPMEMLEPLLDRKHYVNNVKTRKPRVAARKRSRQLTSRQE